MSPLTNEMFPVVMKSTTSEALIKHVDITVKVALVKRYTDKTFNFWKVKLRIKFVTLHGWTKHVVTLYFFISNVVVVHF